MKRHRHSKAVYDEDAAEESPGKDKESLPIVFPLHVRKFQRRDSKAAAMIQKPDTPLYRSAADEGTTMHHPSPQRAIPALKTLPGTPPPLEAAVSVAKTALQQANAQASLAKSAIEQSSKQADRPSDARTEPATLTSQKAQLKRTKSNKVIERQREIEALSAKSATSAPLQRSNTQPKSKDLEAAIPTSRINPFAHFHGTRGYCVRHGRKSSQRSPKGARSTKDMCERGRNGMLIPVGLSARRQMEATSPWVYTGSCSKLTCFIDETQSNADACPDCVAELNIKRKELVEKGDFGTESLVGKEFKVKSDEKRHEEELAQKVAQKVPSPTSGVNHEPMVQRQIETQNIGPSTNQADPQSAMQQRGETPQPNGHDQTQVIDHGKSDIKNGGKMPIEGGPAPASLQEQPRNKIDLQNPGPSHHLSWDSAEVEPPMSTRRATSSGPPSQTKSHTSSHSSTYAASENNVAPTPDLQPRAVHFRALSSSKERDQSHDDGIVVQRDLGDGLDAMILERGGRLERVVMNSRKGGPIAEVMARLARELSQVSSAISTTNPQRRPREHTDGSLDEIIARRKSVAELEHLLRDAADAQGTKLHHQADGSAEDIVMKNFAGEGPPESPLLEEENEEDEEDTIEEILQRTPSQIERAAIRQSIEHDYRALQGYLDSAAATVDRRYQPQPTGLGYRWPTPQQYRSLSIPTSTRMQNPNLGSRTLPIMVEDEHRRAAAPCTSLERASTLHITTTCTSPSTSGLPTLPSHILRAQDMTSPSPTDMDIPPSPLLFTASTAPSLNTSALPSPQTPHAIESPPALVPCAPHSPTETSPGIAVRVATPMPPPMPPPKPLGSPSQVRADSMVIRQVMRMEKNKAVQEAAAVERDTRRRRALKKEGKDGEKMAE